MRHCLPCDASFEKDTRVCPSCGSRLLSDEELGLWREAQEELTNQTFVPIYVLESPVDEPIITELLNDAGVPWMVRGAGDDMLQAAFTFQKGWGVLLVPDAQVGTAREVIKMYQDSQVPDLDDQALGEK